MDKTWVNLWGVSFRFERGEADVLFFFLEIEFGKVAGDDFNVAKALFLAYAVYKDLLGA